MQAFPHHYSVTAHTQDSDPVALDSPGIPTLLTAPPAEFGGPGDQWSPEALLVGAISDCFILSFRAIARAAKFPFAAIRCETIGTLDRVERVTSFTQFKLSVELTVRADAEHDKALKLLQKAKQSCLITQSLKGECVLDITLTRLEAPSSLDSRV